jgi:hypothetical protein
MNGEGQLTSVYRSADANAEQDATAIRNLLMRAGLDARLCDDSVPGVLTGTYEVRVPPGQAAEAESLIATVDQEDPGRADPSSDFDMVTIAELQGATGEMEAMGIKSILDANGIGVVIAGTSTLPNLSFPVMVARADVERAEAVLAEARAAGPAAAIEAQREAEDTGPLA